MQASSWPHVFGDLGVSEGKATGNGGIERQFAIGPNGPLVREATREPRFIARDNPDEAEGGFANGPGPCNGQFGEDVIGRGAGLKDREHGA